MLMWDTSTSPATRRSLWSPRRRVEKEGCHRQHRQHNMLTVLILFIFGTSILVKIGGNIWIKKRLREMGVRASSEYSYIGPDHPTSWPIERGSVLMAFENPKHYALDTRQGALEWSSIIPSSPSSTSPGWVVHLGAHQQPYSISLFHQLKCLDVVRNATVTKGGKGEEEMALARHCLNYLRQMVMCRGDLELESFQFASHKNPIDLHGIYKCKDWSRVYEEVRNNHRGYDEWVKQRR